MVYIKLEEDMDKFFIKNFSGIFKKILFVFYKKIGKIKVQKINNIEYILLPECNDKVLKKLNKISKVKCWTNLCVSNNLMENERFKSFVAKNNFNLMDGKWLFKNIVSQIIEYIVNLKNEKIEVQEISILCNKLDETIVEQIKEISQKVKLFNILTDNIKKFQKIEEQIQEKNGIIINVSNNYKKVLNKSNIIINYDFDESQINKCFFSKNGYFINLAENINIENKEFHGRNIVSYDVYMPLKYIEYQKKMDGFDNNILYESFIYKRTSYHNIRKILQKDNLKIFYLKDSNQKIIKIISPKTLDKIAN